MIEIDETPPGSLAGHSNGAGEQAAGAAHYAALRDRIEARTARVGIIGLGYVGLPLARAFVDKGIRVLGFDTDPTKILRLKRGRSYIGHITDDIIASMNAEGFDSTDRFHRLEEPDVIIICVPTPLTRTREPDLSYVINSVKSIAEPGRLHRNLRTE